MKEDKKNLLPVVEGNDKFFYLNQNKEKDRINGLVNKYVIFELLDRKNHTIEFTVGKLLKYKNDTLQIRKYDDGKLETKKIWTDINGKDLFKDFEEEININNVRGIEEYLEGNQGVKFKDKFINNFCEITNRENKKITVLISSFDNFEVMFYYKYKEGENELIAESSCPIYLINDIKIKYKERSDDFMKLDKEKLGKKIGDFADDAKNLTKNISDKTKVMVTKSKDKMVTTMDANGDGNIDIEDIIVLGLRTPGIRINRSEFLRKELMKKYSEEVIVKSIETTPAKANIPVEEINLIADDVIKFERNCVTGISTALGTPGGVSMVATLPVDIIQYYGYMLRATQKLMYLYGFPEIDVEEKGQTFDSETLNILIICFGVMYGVAGANTAVKVMATGLAKGVSKKIMSTALTKGILYPIVKSIAKWFGVKITKKECVEKFV